MIFVVMATVFCANMLFAANFVNNGGFELPVVPDSNNGGPIDGWYIPATGGGLATRVVTAPLSGQVAYFNQPTLYIYQTFEGVKLLPNRTYVVTYDALSFDSTTKTINAKVLYCSGSGTNSRQIAALNAADVTDITTDGTWLAGWMGVRFTAAVNETPANDPSISHSLMFTTPATITGSTTDDLGITIGGCSVAQVWVDNVSVEVIPEPATIGLLAIIGLAFFRRK